MKPIILLCFALGTMGAAEPSGGKPNILIIVSDDQGYADTGFHGCKDIPTPHLDRLAADGVVCTRGYVTHPFCSPTRAGLLTGRYQQRFGHERNPFYDPKDKTEGLPVSETLLPRLLADAGYSTAWIGKWHLGAAPEFLPEKRGFQHTFGFVGGGHRFLDWKPNSRNEYQVPVLRNGAEVEVKGHLTKVLGDEAASFIRRKHQKPWFLYLAFNAPHTPHEPTKERLARFSGIGDPKRRRYAAQLSLMDDAIGDALKALDETGQSSSTLVFFFSDNGGPVGPQGNGSDNGILRGGKGTMFEGGIRVPFVVTWPGTLPKAKRHDQATSSLDVFATAIAVAGASAPAGRPADGVNLIPVLTGKSPAAPRTLFWRSGSQSAALEGDWKLVRTGEKKPVLFHLKDDPSEKSDLAAAKPAELGRLTAALDEWDKQLAPPVFRGLRREPVSKQP